MTSLLAICLITCIPLGTALGVWIGRSWASLPRLTPGEVVRFRGFHVGQEYRLQVQSVSQDYRGDFDRVEITSVLAETHMPQRKG